MAADAPPPPLARWAPPGCPPAGHEDSALGDDQARSLCAPLSSLASASSQGSSLSFASVSRQSSAGDWGGALALLLPLPPAAPPPPPLGSACSSPRRSDARLAARTLNARLVAARTPDEVLQLASESLGSLDSINCTAAVQKLAKLVSDSRSCPAAVKEAALSSPVYAVLLSLMTGLCHAGLFNSQSTANAFWAAAKLHSLEHPMPPELLSALQTALVRCPPGDSPLSAQGVSAVWYAWGRIASVGTAHNHRPSRAAADVLWERTLCLIAQLDAQGISNHLWAFGLLRRRHGEGFPIRLDVVVALGATVARQAPYFAVQGLSCTAVGCGNMGSGLRAVCLPIMQTVVAECLRRPPAAFTTQAISNIASAIARIGPELWQSEAAQALLASFDARAAELPPALHKPQEMVALCAALRACGIIPTCCQDHCAPSLRDATSQYASGGGCRPTAGACAPAPSYASRPLPPPLPPRAQQQWVPPPPPGAPPPPPYMRPQQPPLPPPVFVSASGHPPLTADQYRYLVHQLHTLAAAQVAQAAPPAHSHAQAGYGGGSRSGADSSAPVPPPPRGVPPPPRALPLPLVVAALPRGQQQAQAAACFASAGSPPQRPRCPPPAPPAAAADEPATATDPAHLLGVLRRLQALKLQRDAALAHVWDE